MLQSCLSDLGVFLTFFLAWELVFTQALVILQVGFPDDDYPNVSEYMVKVIQIYRNSIGDIAAPIYTRWSKMFLDEVDK